jgi:hypothetical protein
MSEADYAQLITAAHHQLQAPVIVIWDNRHCCVEPSGGMDNRDDARWFAGQMVMVSWSKAWRIRWRAGISVASS